MEPENLLEESRREIGKIDAELAELFVRRMQAAEKVAQYKREHGLPVYDPVREDRLLQSNAPRVADETIREYYVQFMKHNMELSRAYQHRLLEGMRVAYSGTEGAFAHIAAGKLFPTAQRIAYGDFGSAYRAVENGQCDVAVLPIENSSNGEVGEVTDLMFSGTLSVNSVLELTVTQDLLVLPGTQLSEIRQVVSHPQALGQCTNYIRQNGWEQIEYPNTALAARWVSERRDRSIAAIASEEAAQIFGLEVLARNIHSGRGNTTRFAAFSRSENFHRKAGMGEHFILMFTVKNEAGALARAVDVIGQHGFNMRTLRSRPMKELLWQYYFYVEAEGGIHSPNGVDMLQDLERFCDRLKLIGTYSKNGN